MSSARGAQRRGAPPVISLTPQPRPALSVEDWEAKAPLGDLETRSVAVLKIASEMPPLPLKFTTDEAGPSSRPSTPNPNYRNRLVAGSSRPGTPLQGNASRLASTSSTHDLHPKLPVQTPQQFYDWFALIDRSVAHSQEAHFRAHVASVSEHLDTCDRLVERIDEVDREVDGMLEGWRGVEEGGKSLKDACERLLEERDRLLALTDDIGSRLEYFQELEHATRMLNHPGESLVLQTDFLYMVERVDICIDYLKTHRHFREAEVYLLRFQQCMTRAMTLIKMYFVGSLRALSSDISKRLSEKDVSPTAQTHLLYTRFKSVSTQLSPLLGELERRAAAYPDELGALLAECHQSYFNSRKALLVGRLTEEIRGLDPGRTELVELTRAGCSYLKQLCTDEFNLYREFFNSGENQLYQYLENLCDYLYDDLRPRILHEPRLTALCEVCTVLQALMVLDVAADDVSSSSSSDDEENDELNLDLDSNTGGRRNGRGGKGAKLGKLHISQLLQMVLQDAQTRLFFKAQAVIQSDIRYYAVKPEDLAYPEILIAARKPVNATEMKEKEIISQIFRSTSLEKQDTWYPTLQKAVWVLSQLHDFVNPAIFEDIAQEAISLCRQSLVSASETLKSKNPPASLLDGQLFLVRHLLILKEITNKLDLVQRDFEPSISFAGVTETLTSVLSKTTSLLPQTLFASLGMPRTDESIREAKHDIDYELRRACEEVITQCAAPIFTPLRTWVDRVHAYDLSRKHSSQPSSKDDPPHTPLAAQDWATQAAARELDSTFRAACERELSASVLRLRLYLEDDRTVGVLVQHVQDRIADEYAAFRDVAWGMYAGDLREVILGEMDLKRFLKGVCEEGGAQGSAK